MLCFFERLWRRGCFWIVLGLVSAGCNPSGNKGSVDAAVLAKLGAEPDWNGLDPEAMSAAQQMWRKVESKDATGEDWGRLGIFLSVHNAEAQALTCWSNAMVLEKNDVRWPYYLAMQSGVLDAAGKEWLWSEAVRCAKGAEKDWARYRQAQFWAEEGKWEQVEGGLSGWVQGDQNFAPARLL